MKKSISYYVISFNKDSALKNFRKKLDKNSAKKVCLSKNTSFLTAPLQKDNSPEIKIQLHGHGLPWIVGPEKFSKEYDKNPYQLALFLKDKIFSSVGNSYFLNKTLIIDLRFCFSGVLARGEYGEFTFIEEFSKELVKLRLEDIIVYGYTGTISGKQIDKQSAFEHEEYRHTGQRKRSPKNCRVEDARVTYKNGELISPAKTVLIQSYEYEADQIPPDFLEKFKNNQLGQREKIDDMDEEKIDGMDNELKQSESLITNFLWKKNKQNEEEKDNENSLGIYT